MTNVSKESYFATHGGSLEAMQNAMNYQVKNNVSQAEVMRLIEEQLNYMVGKGIMFKFSDLMKMDMIDLRDVLKYQEYDSTNPLLSKLDNDSASARLPIEVSVPDDFVAEAGRYGMIPCITTGSLRINKHRFIYFDVKEINIPDDYFVVFVKDYSRIGKVWQGGAEATYKVPNLENRDPATCGDFSDVEIISGKDITDLYKLMPDNWSKYEKRLWIEAVVAYAIQTKTDRGYDADRDFLNLFNIFASISFYSNYILSMNKPRAVRTKKQTGGQSTKRKTVADEQITQPKRIVRNVGKMRIISEKVPKASTKETVTHYKVATWKARGGLRHYKNGKVVPFKPCVKHRQCLKKNDVQAEIPVTIKLHQSVESKTS